MVKKGQIIFGKRRAYQRKLGVADWDCICSAHAMVLEANPETVLPEFLPFFMQSDVFMNRAVAVSEGSLSPTIKWKVLANQNFILPNITIQKEFLSEIHISDRVISLTRESEAAIIQFLSAAYWDIFGEKLGVKDDAKYPTKLNARCDVYKLKKLLAVKPQNGLFVKKDNKDSEGVRFLNVVDCYENSYSGIDHREIIHCSKQDLEKYLLNTGDLIFNRSSLVKSGIGWPYLEIDEFKRSTFDCHLIRIKVDTSKILPDYLYIYALSPWARKYFLCVGQTTTMTTISQSDLEGMPVPVPSIAVQKKIINVFKNAYLAQASIMNTNKSTRTLVSKHMSDLMVNS